MTLKEELEKLRNSKGEIRNLAFYSDGEWTNENIKMVHKFIGDKGRFLPENLCKGEYIFDNNSEHGWFYNWNKGDDNFKNCRKVRYEDVFESSQINIIPLKDRKFRLENLTENESKEVQECCFGNGVYWWSGSKSFQYFRTFNIETKLNTNTIPLEDTKLITPKDFLELYSKKPKPLVPTQNTYTLKKELLNWTKDNKICITWDNEEDKNIILKLLDENGFRWSSGQSVWEYNFSNKYIFIGVNNTLRTTSKDVSYIANNYNIFYLKDIINEKGLNMTTTNSLREELEELRDKDGKIKDLAFYKKSGEDWTDSEYKNILTFTKTVEFSKGLDISIKWIFYSEYRNTYFSWNIQEHHSNFPNLKQVAYEDIFNTKQTTKDTQEDDLSNIVKDIPLDIEEIKQKSSKNLLKISIIQTSWKNPKPKMKNLNKINEGDLIISENDIRLIQEFKKSIMNQEDCWLVYEKNKISTGDVVVYLKDNKIYTDIVIRINSKSYKTTSSNIKDDEIIRIFGRKTDYIIEPTYYSCGNVMVDNTIYSKESFETKFKTAKKKNENILEYSYELSNISKKYSIDIQDLEAKDKEILRKVKVMLDHPLKIKRKEWVMLVGDSGSGKTNLAIDYAKDKNMEYVIEKGNAQITKDDLEGFFSFTTLEYKSPLLRDAVENGKVYIFDEIDACNPNTLLILNGLKKDTVQFPDKLVNVHSNFRLIATANTLTYSEDYNARSPMDKATIARFQVVIYNLKEPHLAIRYGLDNILEAKELVNTKSNVKFKDLPPRDVERIVDNLIISKELNDYNMLFEDMDIFNS